MYFAKRDSTRNRKWSTSEVHAYVTSDHLVNEFIDDLTCYEMLAIPGNYCTQETTIDAYDLCAV